MRFIATTSPGLEGLLFEELSEFGLGAVLEESGGAVSFEGEWIDAANVLQRSRIASRVLWSLRKFSAKNNAMLYDQVRRIDWKATLQPGLTIAVFAHGTSEGTDYTMSFAPLRIKDALCDEIKKQGQDRPNVDRHNPDLRIEALFNMGKCELSVDLAGMPLHRRGYRREGAEAPLRESRAAALLRFAGYDGSRPLMDPFCATGTIPIEAALIALKRAPGLLRRMDSYSMWKIAPECRAAIEAVRAAIESEALHELPHPITGRDISKKILNTARTNAELAGVGKFIKFEDADALTIVFENGDVVTNPPYGERLHNQGDPVEIVSGFTRQLKHHCAGSRITFVIPTGELENAIGFKPKKRLKIFNGPLESRYVSFDIYAGSKKHTI